MWLVSITLTSHAQKVQQKIPQKTRILFLLDGSGSMLAKWERNRLRIDIAKEVLSNLVDSLRTNKDLELALRVYGHQFGREKKNCRDTRLEVGFGENNHDAIINRLQLVKPKGTTPIAFSLEQAANDFPVDKNFRNIIIIITDGIESCDGDPCDVSLALQRKNIFLKPFVIGLGMSLEYEKQFKCVGKFFDGSDISNFNKALNQALETTLSTTTVSVELLDINDRKTESNVNVTFLNNFTREPAYEFVHYRDTNGRPDSVEIDGVLTYDLIVNTTPPVIKRNVPIRPGKHNVIEIKSPQGFLQVNQRGHQSYRHGVNILVREAGKRAVINVQPISDLEKYLVGEYDLEVTTLPRRYFRKVKVNQSNTTKIAIKDPGLVNIYNNAPGYGSIYEIKSNGKEEWVANLEENKSKSSLALQPGKYKIAFRAKNAQGSKFTTIKSITVRSGETTTINLFD
ncbi:MAG: VWA domain-containing protein [Bacteroidota bacterium]